LILARDLSFVELEVYGPLENEISELRRMLSSFISTISASD